MSEVYELKFCSAKRNQARVLSYLNFYKRKPQRYGKSRMVTQYYDNSYWTAFYDSKDGQMIKNKYRFRDYLDPEDGAHHSIEIKKKTANTTSKIKFLLYKKLSASLKQLPFHQLVNEIEHQTGVDLGPIREDLPQQILNPVIAIYYDRYRFDDYTSNSRFNLDCNIKYFRHEPTDVASGITVPHDVFEIKTTERELYEQRLPELELEFQSFSKFSWCMDQKYGTEFIV